MKKTINFLTEREGLATVFFFIWQLCILIFMILTAITHKTYFSETADYWLAWDCILFVWLLTMVATYLDGKKYLPKEHFPNRLFVPAGYQITYGAVLTGIVAFYLYYSLGIFGAAHIIPESESMRTYFTMNALFT